MGSDPVDNERDGGKHDPLLELRNPEDITKTFDHAPMTSIFPPAARIFSVACLENLCAEMFSGFVRTPSARTFNPARRALTSPISRSSPGETFMPGASRSRPFRFTMA